jgi:hypothetical protein
MRELVAATANLSPQEPTFTEDGFGSKGRIGASRRAAVADRADISHVRIAHGKQSVAESMVGHQPMRIAVCVFVAFIAGCIFAWLPVAALCSLPGVRYSNACGHNAVYLFILTLPLGFILAAHLASRLYAKWHKQLRLNK